jgi:hypothetical protein
MVSSLPGLKLSVRISRDCFFSMTHAHADKFPRHEP